MSTFSEQLRSQAADLRSKAAELEAIAGQLDAVPASDAPIQFVSDTRCNAVIEAVAAACHVDIAVFWSKNRSDDVATARHIAAHALHTLLGMRREPISRALRWADHASTCHALRNVRRRRDTDRAFAVKLSRAMAAANAVVAQQEGISA